MVNPFVMLEDTIVGMIVFHNDASLGSIGFKSFLSLDGFIAASRSVDMYVAKT